MMRSLYSGVAGLKTHQTKMDVIGNNIANVNTVGFKSSAVNFADTFYQTMSAATGPNVETGAAGSNAKQIGLGSLVASITTNITEAGGTSTTNRALDVAINGDSFLVVKSGGATYFTKSGALNVDENGTLYCTTNNATVQGWLADADGNVVRDSVKDLAVMTPDKTTIAPTATGNVTLTGNIDKHDKDLETTVDKTTQEGFVMTFSFYDRIGEEFTVQMRLQNSATSGAYKLVVSDVVDSTGTSIFVTESVDADGNKTYADSGATVMLGGTEFKLATVDEKTGKHTLEYDGDPSQIVFNAETGEYSTTVESIERPDSSIYAGKAIVFDVTNPGTGRDDTFVHYAVNNGNESGGVEVDVSYLTQFQSGGKGNTSYNRGDAAGYGAGNIAGEMMGISIDEAGKVIGTYTNGEKKVLAQIAVTTFENPSGLEAVGNSLFQATLNSGLFDGVGQDITASGGKFTVGALEMSNVDLASEFTSMITTQRGFQANSRIITTSDSMLEELVNLKR